MQANLNNYEFVLIFTNYETLTTKMSIDNKNTMKILFILKYIDNKQLFVLKYDEHQKQQNENFLGDFA